jgi:NAD+ diphosphatase
MQSALHLHLAEGDVDSADFAVLGTRPEHDDASVIGEAIARVQLEIGEDDRAVVVIDAASGSSAIESEEALLEALNSNHALQSAFGGAGGARATFAVGNPRALYMQPTGTVPERDMSDFALGRGVLMWHASHRFDGTDGSRTTITAGGFKRVGASGRSTYPRVDPVAIMGIIHPAGDRMLVGRQRAFPPGMYSTLAGFVEPGETLEAAVARESAEEAGVLVDPRRVKYVSSQPWPLASSGAFSQLMLGALAPAETDQLAVDENELEHACWIDVDTAEAMVKASLLAAQKGSGVRRRRGSGNAASASDATGTDGSHAPAAAAGGGEAPVLVQGEKPPGKMFLPGPYAIAHHIVAAWVVQCRAAGKADAHL